MKRIILPFICLFVLIHSEAISQNRMQDSIALVTLYDSTGGPSWNNAIKKWGSGPINNWYGVTLNSSKRVYRLNLSNNGLEGILPDSIGKLNGLDWLYLNGNDLSGSIPDSLGRLTNLTILDLSDNQLSGVIPSQLEKNTNLTSISLDNNMLSGDFPDLSKISGLNFLSVTGNKFTFKNLKSSGILPDDIDVFQYSPQDTILSISQNIENWTLTIDIEDDPLNHYDWYKDGSPISETTRTIIPPAGGLYNCLVTNSDFPGLTLYSDIFDFQYSYQSDSIALLALFNATNGIEWSNNTNWLAPDTDLSEWYGITLDGEQRVSKIDLSGNLLKGTLPLEMANLSHLVSLAIDHNQLSGNLPPLKRAETLDEISVENNKLVFSDLSTTEILPGDISSFVYAPQDTMLPLFNDQYAVTLTVGDGADINNSYKWYLDNVLKTEDTRTIVVNEEGLFNCEVTNSIYTGLILYTDTLDISFSFASDSIALVHLYNETDGLHWTNRGNWLSGRLSTWFGVTLDGGNRVQKVLLPRNKLNGIIPNEIGNLTHLTQLNLSNNQLSGTIPSEIEKLTELTILRLYSNQLTGTIPDGIIGLVNLTELGLHFNQLSGTIPTGIVDLINLKSLNLSNNQLTGMILSEIDNLVNLTWLALSDNLLTGGIPVVIGDMTLLEGIELNGNNFSGSIPAEMGNLTALTQLSLDDNDLTGNIPTEIGQLTNLNYLSLAGNQLGGTIPVSFAGLTVLTELLLNNNQLTGEIPSVIRFLTSLSNLNLAKNHFSGSIPSDLGNLTALITLSLDSNNFIGDIPVLSGATLLSELSVNNNHFTFSNLISSELLPSDLARFVYTPQDTIFELDYDLNAATLSVIDDGEVDNEYSWFRDTDHLTETTNAISLTHEGNYFCHVTNPHFPDLTICSDSFRYSYSLVTDSVALVALYNNTGGANWTIKTNWLSGLLSTWAGVTLSGGRVSKIILNNNNITGTLPPEIGNLTKLSVLQLQNNLLSGSLPAELAELVDLTDLRLNNNQLSGSIPACIGSFNGLVTLYLNNNQFAGTIPTEMGNLSLLIYLSLNSNQLSGEIPEELGALTQLQTLNLSINQLTGSLPDQIGGLSGLQYLYLSNNQLTGTLPANIGDLTLARTINLSGNGFSGQLPVEIGNLDNLRILNISGNNFSGSIPADIGYLSSLQEFYIANNAFHFIDIEPVLGWSISSFSYSPQAKIGLTQTIPGYIGSPLKMRIAGYIAGIYDAFQWYKNDILQPGKTDSVFNIPTYAESNSGIYRCVVTNSLASTLTLTSNDITVESYSVPVNLTLTNVSVGNGITACYGATQDITVAGGVTTVGLQNGSNTTFIAGHSIRFLPGFHAYSGSFMDAHITTTASFCESPGAVIAPESPSEKSIADQNIQNLDKNGVNEKLIKIFPNPNNGKFTIELCHFEKPVKVSIVNVMGVTVYPARWIGSDLSEIELSNLNRGLYFVRIDDGKVFFSKKIIVQ